VPTNKHPQQRQHLSQETKCHDYYSEAAYRTKQSNTKQVRIHQLGQLHINDVRETDLPHVVEKCLAIVSPVTWEISSWWEFVAAELQGNLKAVAAQVVEVLHS